MKNQTKSSKTHVAMTHRKHRMFIKTIHHTNESLFRLNAYQLFIMLFLQTEFDIVTMTVIISVVLKDLKKSLMLLFAKGGNLIVMLLWRGYSTTDKTFTALGKKSSYIFWEEKNSGSLNWAQHTLVLVEAALVVEHKNVLGNRDVKRNEHACAIFVPCAKTSQELRMLSSVTLNCQVTKFVKKSSSQLSEM